MAGDLPWVTPWLAVVSPGEPKIGSVGQNGGEKRTFVGAAFAGAQVCVMSNMRGRRRASASARRRLHLEDGTTRGEPREKRALLLMLEFRNRARASTCSDA